MFKRSNLKVILSDNQITLGINGDVLGTWTDTRISGLNSVGLFNFPYSNKPYADARYDNFSVKLLPGEMLSALETTQLQATLDPSSPNLLWYLREYLPDSAQADELIRH